MKINENIDRRVDMPAVALGFFDGLHLGHKKLLDTLIQYANEKSKIVFTFKNHPDRLIGLNTKYILTNDERLDFFRSYNIDEVYFVDFSQEFMKMSKERFICDILLDKLNVGVVIVGYDYTFGYKASGTPEYLSKRLKESNRDCIVIDPVRYNNQIISSTLIRNLISEGKIKLANSMLGYRFFIKGIVKKGQGLGRTLGFPTLNIEYDKEKILPKKGVYLSNTIIDGNRFLSITNVGVNPTVCKSDDIRIETFVLGFDKEIYGKSIEVQFIDFVREEKRFVNVEELKAQIKNDVEYVKGLYCKIGNLI